MACRRFWITVFCFHVCCGAQFNQTGVANSAGQSKGDGVSWLNPGSSVYQGSGYASNNLNNGEETTLLTIYFTFNIPANAALKGFQLDMSKRCKLLSGAPGEAYKPYDTDVKILYSVVSIGNQYPSPSEKWPENSTDFFNFTYGGESDLWEIDGYWATIEHINSGDFGIGFRAAKATGSSASRWELNMDAITFTIFYDASNESTSAVPPIFSSLSGSSGDTSSESDEGLRSGAIIGIGVGAGAVVVVSAIGAFFFRRRLKKRRSMDELADETDKSEYSSSINEMPMQEQTQTYVGIPAEVVVHKAIEQISFPRMDDDKKSQNKWSIGWDELSIKDELGRGTFGVVFKASWRGGLVAVKKLLTDKLTPSELAAFTKEVELLSNLRPHTNIVQFLGASLETGSPLCLVTEYMPGGNLFNYLRTNINVNNTMRRNWVNGIAAGMRHLQAEGIVHRDLAARNVLLTNDLAPKISDFGMSRFNESEGSSTTESGVGPLKWMAPESLSSMEYSVKSDVWSFGVTLFEIYTGQKPYETMSPAQTAIAVVTKQARLELPANTGITTDVLEIFDACLNYDKKDRPDFVDICSALLVGE